MTPLGTPRTCCDTVTGEDHRACPTTGHNAYGVAMCVCKRDSRPHSWEPGESCYPRRVIPPAGAAVAGGVG